MKLGFGLMRLPLSEDKNIDMEHFKSMVDAFIKNGGTYFDTAYPYHNQKSEGAFKLAVADRYPRNSYTIANKMPMFFVKEKDDLSKFFSEQIQRCGVEYFDYYLLHCLDKDNYAMAEKTDAFQFILNKKKEGKVKKIGFSFHDNAELLDKILTEHPETEFVQLQINYLDWEDNEIQSKLCYEVARKHKKDIIIMEPIKGGSLVNIPDNALQKLGSLSPVDFAFNFTASLEGVIFILSGMSNDEQMSKNISLFKNLKPFDKAQFDLSLEIAQIIRKSLEIPCTSCQYCVSVCKAKIEIPKIFQMHNKKDYTDYKALENNAADCLKCGECEKLCPQHIEIRNILEKIAKKFE